MNLYLVGWGVIGLCDFFLIWVLFSNDVNLLVEMLFWVNIFLYLFKFFKNFVCFNFWVFMFLCFFLIIIVNFFNNVFSCLRDVLRVSICKLWILDNVFNVLDIWFFINI